MAGQNSWTVHMSLHPTSNPHKVFDFTLRGRHLEFVPALFLMLWGAWVANPWTHALDGTFVFTVMTKLAPAWVWGTFYLLVGIAQTLFIFTTKIHLRKWTSFISIWILSSLSVLSFIGNWHAVAGITYFSIMVCEMFAYTEIVAEEEGKK